MLQLSGIIPPVVTPLKSADQLDSDAVARIAEHLLGGGVNGLFALGTTGEGPSLTYQVRYEMVDRMSEVCAGRVPLLVGITDTCLQESVHLAEHASKCGVDAVVAAPPFYFPVDQAALVAWFRRLADQSPLPVMLYNIPSCARPHVEVETVVELSDHPNIIGVKDSCGDLDHFQRLCAALKDVSDFVVFMGPEELLPEAVAAGAHGGVCGGANLLPNIYVSLYQAAVLGDAAEISRLQSIVRQMFSGIYQNPAGQMNYLPALKHALGLTELCSGLAAPPLLPVATDHSRQIQDRLPAILEAAGVDLPVRIA